MNQPFAGTLSMWIGLITFILLVFIYFIIRGSTMKLQKNNISQEGIVLVLLN